MLAAAAAAAALASPLLGRAYDHGARLQVLDPRTLAPVGTLGPGLGGEGVFEDAIDFSPDGAEVVQQVGDDLVFQRTDTGAEAGRVPLGFQAQILSWTRTRLLAVGWDPSASTITVASLDPGRRAVVGTETFDGQLAGTDRIGGRELIGYVPSDGGDARVAVLDASGRRERTVQLAGDAFRSGLNGTYLLGTFNGTSRAVVYRLEPADGTLHRFEVRAGRPPWSWSGPRQPGIAVVRSQQDTRRFAAIDRATAQAHPPFSIPRRAALTVVPHGYTVIRPHRIVLRRTDGRLRWRRRVRRGPSGYVASGIGRFLYLQRAFGPKGHRTYDLLVLSLRTGRTVGHRRGLYNLTTGDAGGSPLTLTGTVLGDGYR